jgi:hypothetical protein
MDRIVQGITKFSEAYVDYVCHVKLMDGFYVEKYQCESAEVVDYLIDSIQAASIFGPLQVTEIPQLPYNYDGMILSISITDTKSAINYTSIAFITPTSVLVGQSIKGLTAFNLYYTTVDSLNYKIDEASNGNLAPLTGVTIQLYNPLVELHAYMTVGKLELNLPRISTKHRQILDRIREEYIEYVECDECSSNPIICGNLVTELDSATYLKVKRLRKCMIIT